jgi:hypothetical protein
MRPQEDPEVKQKLIGEHWNESTYSKLYQLYRRVAFVAHRLEKRRQHGWVPTKKYIAELYDISTELKVLDSQTARRR